MWGAGGAVGVVQATVARSGRRALTSRVSAAHLVMVVAGLAGVLLTLRVIATADDTRPVVVAARDLAPGTVLDAGALTTTRLAADRSVVAGLFEPDDVEELRGRVVTERVETGGLVTRAGVRAVADGAAPRAMSFAVPAARAVAGALRAGDRVDVIAVDDGVASYVMRDVEVLAVAGDESDPLGGSGDELTITLAVEPDAALAFAAAADAGRVTLVRTTGADR